MSTNGRSETMKLQPTSAREWRKMREEGVPLTLPSGNVGLLRPVGIDELVRRGRIPDQLSQIAAEALFAGNFDQKRLVEIGTPMVDFLNIIVEAAFVEPRVTMDEPGEGEISVDDVDIADKAFVFGAVTGGASALANFRRLQERDVDAVRDGDEDRAATERAARVLG